MYLTFKEREMSPQVASIIRSSVSGCFLICFVVVVAVCSCCCCCFVLVDRASNKTLHVQKVNHVFMLSFFNPYSGAESFYLISSILIFIFIFIFVPKILGYLLTEHFL